MSQPRSGMATATSFHFRGVTSALDEDSDDEICYQDQDFADVPQKAQKTTNQQSTKRMSMTSDLNSTPNGGREWRRSSHSSTAMVIGDNDNDEIQYTPLDNGRGPQPKLSLTERILKKNDRLSMPDLYEKSSRDILDPKNMSTLRVLEFYSGIGGMHFAAEEAGWDYKILRAFDINTTANEVYAHNHGKAAVAQRNIEALPLEFYDAQKADVWTMSPPCQPHTRTGLKLDSKDPRSKSFLYLMNMLPNMKNPPKYILVENVKGFDSSDSRQVLIQQLEACNYSYQEFLLNPLQMGIPNSRLRYYLLAKAKPLAFMMEPTATIIGFVPTSKTLATEFTDERGLVIKDDETILRSGKVNKRPVCEFLEKEQSLDEYKVPDKTLLKHGHAFDIVKPNSLRSCCFTKGYYHYVEATGSILQVNEAGNTDNTFNLLQQWKDSAREINATGTPASPSADSEQQILENLHKLQLRYFTPREVGNLMGFPASFGFPETMSLKQKYRTLGNSINVLVVAELMKYLVMEGNSMEPMPKVRKLSHNIDD